MRLQCENSLFCYAVCQSGECGLHVTQSMCSINDKILQQTMWLMSSLQAAGTSVGAAAMDKLGAHGPLLGLTTCY